MPRFPYISSIFLLLAGMAIAVVVPNATDEFLPVRSDIETELSSRLDVNIGISGDIRLRVLPRPQLILEDVSIAQSDTAADLLAMQVPRLIINLDVVAFAQRRISVTKVTMIDADINVQLADDAAGFIRRMQSRPRPEIDLLDGNFRITGLNALEPARSVSLTQLSLFINAGGADDKLNLSGQKRLADGSRAVAQMQVQRIARQTELAIEMSLGANERARFNGFISYRDEDWQLNGELELNSAALLANVAEADLPVQLAPEARSIRLAGLVRGDVTGLSAESMEVEMLNTAFRSRLAFYWPQNPEGNPVLTGRMTTGALNLDLLSFRPKAKGEQALLSGVWRSFAPSLESDFRIEATRFDVGGETGSDLVLAFDWYEDAVEIERFNLALPFSTSLLLTGQVDLSTSPPGFAGNFSARSSDTLAAILWGGDRINLDLATITEGVDETRLQRLAIVGDVLFNDDGLALDGLAARFGDDYLTANIKIADINGPRIDAMVRLDRLDFVDWGVVDKSATNREGEVSALWPRINRLLGDYLKTANTARQINMDIAISDSFAGPENIGPLILQADISDQQLRLGELRFDDFGGAKLSVSGQLNYDEAPHYGNLALAVESTEGDWFGDWLFSGFGPIGPTARLPISFNGDVIFSAPDADDWPMVKLTGTGKAGAMRTDFSAATPSRVLNLSQAGSDVRLTMDGQANQLAALFSLPQIYQKAEVGALGLTLQGQTNELSTLNGSLQLAEDQIAIASTLRPTAAGARLEGGMDIRLANILPLFDVTAGGDGQLAISGKTQLSATQESVSFTALDLLVGGDEGRINGEGVLVLSQRLPQLNMNLNAADIDLSWLLPRFGKTGWRQGEMQWDLLGRGNADIGLRASNMTLGKLLVEGFDGRVKLTDGVLEAPSLAVAMLGGQVDVNLQAEGGSLPPRFALEGDFTAVNPRSLMLSLYGNRLIDAPVSGALNLNGRGNSVGDMMASLAGDARFEIAPGLLTVFDAMGFADAVTSAEFSGTAAEQAALFTGADELSFARGLGLAEFRQGQMTASNVDIVFAEGLNEARLEAVLDMLNLQMNGLFSLYPVDRQRPVLWQLSGDMRRPRIEIDASAFDVVPTAAANRAATPNSKQQPAE